MKRLAFLTLMLLGFSLYAQKPLLVGKICDVGPGTLFNDPGGIAEYYNGKLIFNGHDTVALPYPQNKIFEIKPGPNGLVVKIGDSLMLKGTTFLYEGRPISWYPCAQGVIVEEKTTEYSQLLINGVQAIYTANNNQKIEWVPGPGYGPILAYVQKENHQVEIILADGSSRTVKCPTKYWNADQSGIIFESDKKLGHIDLEGNIKILYEGPYDDYSPSRFGLLWSKTTAGLTDIYLNGQLIFSDYLSDWGPCEQGLQIISGRSILIMRLETP